MSFQWSSIGTVAPRRQLGEVIEFRNEIVHPKDRPSGSATFVGLEHIERDTGIRTGQESIELSEMTGRRARFRSGDIVYGYLRPYLNKVWIADFDGLCSVDQYVLKIRPGFDRDYVSHFLRSNEFLRIAPIDSAPGQLPRIRSGEIAATPIPLPPLDEQRRIAAILDKADALRRKRKRALELLDGLPQAIFLEMFGSGNQEVPLADVCARVTDGTHQAPKWAESGVPFLFVSNVRNQKISFDTDKFVSEDTYDELTRYAPVEAGDVLYTAVGSYGHAAEVPAGKRFIFQRHIAHLKLDRRKVLPSFLVNAMESSSFKAQADRIARGVAQKTVTLGELKSLRVPLPGLVRQGEFAKVVEKVAHQRMKASAAIADGAILFASLQHRAFTGQL